MKMMLKMMTMQWMQIGTLADRSCPKLPPPFPSPPYYHTLLPTRPSISPKTTLEYYPSQYFTNFTTSSVANCSVSPKVPPKTLLILVLPPTTVCPSISPQIFALPVPVFPDCSMITAQRIKTISLLDEFLYQPQHFCRYFHIRLSIPARISLAKIYCALELG